MYELIFEEGKILLSKKEISEYISNLLSFLEEKGSFSISFVSENTIKKLNADYRGRDEVTDILTFAQSDGEEFPSPDAEKELGDIFICLERMKENAADYGVSEDEELKRLILHGILHLEGFDHDTNDFSSEPMLKKQEEILKKIL